MGSVAGAVAGGRGVRRLQTGDWSRSTGSVPRPWRRSSLGAQRCGLAPPCAANPIEWSNAPRSSRSRNHQPVWPSWPRIDRRTLQSLRRTARRRIEDSATGAAQSCGAGRPYLRARGSTHSNRSTSRLIDTIAAAAQSSTGVATLQQGWGREHRPRPRTATSRSTLAISRPLP